MLYVFDMDGTLTPPRLPMTDAFAARFFAWQKKHRSFMATGSDFSKVSELLPQSAIEAFTGIYCLMGKVIYRNEFEVPVGLLDKLENFRKVSEYPGELFPNYIESRITM